MQQQLSISIPKDELGALPAAEFSGRIFLIETAADARAALRYLSRCTMVGFDTETRPSFRKGCSHKVSLIQISTEDTCFLFRINKTGFLQPLRDLLESESVIKIGLSTKDDIHGLNKIERFEPKNFIELQHYVHKFGITDASLTKIYGIVFGQRISKGQRLSNWEAGELTSAQQHYAALDAWACLKLYQHLSAGNFNPEESQFIVTPEEEARVTESESEI